jgi:hypothetical protein
VISERTTKTRTGAKSSDQRAVPPKMFAQPENLYCPIAMYKLYNMYTWQKFDDYSNCLLSIFEVYNRN